MHKNTPATANSISLPMLLLILAIISTDLSCTLQSKFTHHSHIKIEKTKTDRKINGVTRLQEAPPPQETTGVSFYFPLYKNTIGTQQSLSHHKQLVQNIFQLLKEHHIPTARTWLTIGSEYGSGINYNSGDYNFLQFHNLQSASNDVLVLLEEAYHNNITLSLVLHNYDLASPQSYNEIVHNPAAQQRFLDNDKKLLLHTLSMFIERHGLEALNTITGIEFINEPDNMQAIYNIPDSQTSSFVQAGVQMLKDVELKL